MRALVSTSAKLKSKLGEEDSWELTRESDDEEDQYEDESSSVYQCKAEEQDVAHYAITGQFIFSDRNPPPKQ